MLRLGFVCALANTAHADLLNHDRLRAHVAQLDISHTTRADLDTSRLTFSVTALVPGLGTYRLEKRVFGDVRPAGIIGDWGLGGIVPVVLLIGSYAVDDAGDRRAMRWAALGLYAGTRIAILTIGNLHIGAYRRALDVRFAATPNTAGIALRW